MKIYKYFCLIGILIILAFSGCSGGEIDGALVMAPILPEPGFMEFYPDDVFGPVGGVMGSAQPTVPGAQNDSDTMVVVISDIHLGDQRSIDNGYGWFIKNEDLLAAFLNLLAQRPNVKELVIAGDMFDEWVLPMTYATFNGFTPDKDGESKYVDTIAAAHPKVINGIKAVMAAGIKVTYVPGNHDMLVTEEDINRIFPGIHQQRDVAGLGAYSPDGLPEVVIEHGHRYDFYNAPDMISNRKPISPEDYTTNPNAIIPPGFFVSKIAATHDIEFPALPELPAESVSERDPYLYWIGWKAVLLKVPVKEDKNAKIIKSGIDGYTADYAINDLAPQGHGLAVDEPLLYKKIEDTWQERQVKNKVNVPITVVSALLVGSLNIWCDHQATTQYFFHDSSKRVVVFGHTHDATIGYRINTRLEKCIYANSGTWIDKNDLSRSFVVIRTQPANGKINEYVSVYQFTDKQLFKKISEDVITK